MEGITILYAYRQLSGGMSLYFCVMIVFIITFGIVGTMMIADGSFKSGVLVLVIAVALLVITLKTVKTTQYYDIVLDDGVSWKTLTDSYEFDHIRGKIITVKDKE